MNNEKLKLKILEKYLVNDFQNERQELLSKYCILDNGIKIKNISFPYLDVKALRGQIEPVIKNEGIKINKGDFAILVDGENSGEVFQMPCDGYLGSTLKKLTFLNGVNDIYIRYFIDLNKELLKNSKTGAAIPHLNKKLFANLVLHVPSKDIQNKIVDKIDKLFKLIDKKEKNDQEKEKLKEVLKDRILDSAISGLLLSNDSSLPSINYEEYNGDIPFDVPANWKWITLEKLTNKIGSGSTPSGGSVNYVEKGIPFIREQNVYNDGFLLSGLVYITEEMNNKKKGSIFYPDDLLLNITGGSIGRCLIVPKDFGIGNINQHVMIIRFKDKEFAPYIHYVINSPYIQKMINVSQVGDKPGLSAKRTKEFLIPVPPLEEQKKIVEKIEQCFELIEQL